MLRSKAAQRKSRAAVDYGTNEREHLRPRSLDPILFSCDGHALDAQGGTRDRAAPLKVVTDLRDVVPHVLQIPGDRDFLDRESKLTILDPHAACAARKIAGHKIHTKAQKLGHEQPFLNIANDLL